MSAVTSKELDELETMISHATPGPWCNVWLDRVYRSVDGWMAEHVSNSGPISQEPDATKYCAANARLIAALRNAAPALIAAARENARLTQELAMCRVAADAGRKLHELDLSGRGERAAETAKLRAVVEAARKLRVIEMQRDKDDAEHAASGMTYGITTLVKAQRELDAALSALDAKGGGQ